MESSIELLDLRATRMENIKGLSIRDCSRKIRTLRSKINKVSVDVGRRKISCRTGSSGSLIEASGDGRCLLMFCETGTKRIKQTGRLLGYRSSLFYDLWIYRRIESDTGQFLPFWTVEHSILKIPRNYCYFI